MPATVSHNLSATTPDNPTYEIRPSHWNDSHAVSLNISATEISGLFSNANGVSFGLSNNSITASIAAGGAPGSVSAGTTRFGLGEVVFSNSNGVSFGLNGATVTATVQTNYLTSQSNQAFSASGGSSAFQTLNFNNANGFTFSNNLGSVEGSYTVPTVTNSSWSVSDAGTSGTVARLAFTNLNGVTLSLSSGAGGSHTIVGSHNALTSQSNQAFSAAGGSSAFQTLNFADTNGVSFTNTGGSLGVASVKLSLYAVSNTTQSSSGTANHTALSFGGAGIASVGVTGGSVVISVPSGGGGITNINVSAGTTSNNLSNVTFSNSNDVSFGLNASTITASIPAASHYQNFGAILTTVGTAQGNSLVSIQSFSLSNQLVFSSAVFPMSFNIGTAANNSSCNIDLTVSAVIYTRNASTLSSILSFANNLSQSWTSNNTGSVTGVIAATATVAATTLPAGSYFVALHVSTTNTATGAATTNLGVSITMPLAYAHASAVALAKSWGGQTNNSINLLQGLGVISTGATRASIAFSDYTMTGSRNVLAPVAFIFRNEGFQL